MTGRKVQKAVDTDIKKIDEIIEGLQSWRLKLGDADCPNNADLKGQALEKIGSKLAKLDEQLQDIRIEPTSASPKLSAAHEGLAAQVD